MKPTNGNGNNAALRVTMVCLLLFLFSGVVFSVIHGIETVGLSAQTVSDYYRGNEEALIYAKDRAELMESTHVHIFMVPLVFYVLCHIFAQTTMAAKWKITVIACTFINIAGFIAAPYIIRYVAPGYAFMMSLHHFLFIVTASILAGAPVREISSR
jgi:hypothetical protein